jgi:hypothetical protein
MTTKPTHWHFINPTAMQQWAWTSAYLCPHCGTAPPPGEYCGGGCYCRRCDSCTQDWVDVTLAEGDEGRPQRQDCPECVEANAKET